MELIGFLAIGLGIFIAIKMNQKIENALEEDSKETKEVITKIQEEKNKPNYNEMVLEKYRFKEKDGINLGEMPVIIKNGEMQVDDSITEEEYYNLRLERLNEEIQSIIKNNYKGHLVFHGGCLSCIAPEMINVGHCYGCRYYGNGSKDKSIELKDSHPEHNFDNILKGMER